MTLPAVPFRRRLLVPVTAALMLGLPLAAQAEVAFQYDLPAIAPRSPPRFVRSPAGPRSASPWPRPTRWPPTPATRS